MAAAMRRANRKDLSLGLASSRSSDVPRDWKPRKVFAFSDAPEVVVTLCEEAAFLCVLPDALVARALSGRLTRLCDAGSSSRMYALRRKPLPNQMVSLLDDLVASLRRGLT